MKTSYRILGIKRREHIRDIASDAWCTTRDRGQAEKLAARRIRISMGGVVGSILLGVAVKLAVELIVFWAKQKIWNPSLDFSTGEPGAES